MVKFAAPSIPEPPKKAQSVQATGDASKAPAENEWEGTPQGLKDMGNATLLIVLAAITSRISQLSLAPVYGSIPSSVNHQAAIVASALIGWTTQWYWRPTTGNRLQYLPLWAVCAPVLTCLSFQFSDSLGLVWGPVVGGFLSSHSIVIPTIYAAAMHYDGPNVAQTSSGPLAHLFSGVPSLGLFLFIDWTASEIVNKFITTWSLLNPFNGHLIIALYLALLLTERRTLIIAIISIATILGLVSPYGSGPLSTSILENSLNSQNWTLLDRQWSNTGYLSVLENVNANYRVMRCDHSLLGGEWQLTPERRSKGWKISESIYAAFHMLEAVRLMEIEPKIDDSEAQALVIGLGIGTAPKALIGHGINTTIVELDPVVHSLATDYFSLPTNHTAVLTDAIAWVKSEANPKAPEVEDEEKEAATPAPIPEIRQYDYIIHDVFTGGAEPLPLFTTSFLSSLRSLLKPNGVAAINYAGDLSLPLTSKVLNTIDLAFDRNCALYRDSAPPSDSESTPETEKDGDKFANYILFCRNTPGAVSFRQPTKADYLDSISRKQHLFPRPEYAVEFPLRNSERAGEVLENAELGQWKREQEESAGRHWGIMRVVLPGRIWGLY
ncbi:hypothetical protein Q7P37_005645 [Cladosporium fusiforme]